jgi:hypothetical protein
MTSYIPRHSHNLFQGAPYTTGNAKQRSEFVILKGRAGGANCPSYRPEVMNPGAGGCIWISFISENEYNHAAGRYKLQVAELPPQEDPADLIRETLTIERDITEGLEKLLEGD